MGRIQEQQYARPREQTAAERRSNTERKLPYIFPVAEMSSFERRYEGNYRNGSTYDARDVPPASSHCKIRLFRVFLRVRPAPLFDSVFRACRAP
jgi:hypothetical protein